MNTLPLNRLKRDDIVWWLNNDSEEDVKLLYEHAYNTKLKYTGNRVFFRGLIEFSNICNRNCYYCGIRMDNKALKRYWMPEDEIIQVAKWAYKAGYGSVVLQSGEMTTDKFIYFVDRVLKRIKEETEKAFRIVLSLGEQDIEVYRMWRVSGADRYLLRIETSNKRLFQKIHPPKQRYENRIRCLEYLRELDYQVGSGVMIGIPGQSIEDLADDIIFFKDMDIDMIGMGPYIPSEGAPMGIEYTDKPGEAEYRFLLSLKMIALTRLYLQDVNIASTTALQALKPLNGRELGLKAGANVLMPIITPMKYRESYQLYDGKPCIYEGAGECKNCLERRIRSIGEVIAYNNGGDPIHYIKRQKNNLRVDFIE